MKDGALSTASISSSTSKDNFKHVIIPNYGSIVSLDKDKILIDWLVFGHERKASD